MFGKIVLYSSSANIVEKHLNDEEPDFMYMI
jgi:hypothetical protein